MPNWCESFLIVTGQRNEIEQFNKAFFDFPANWDSNRKLKKRYSFNALYPVPQEVLEKGFSAPGPEDLQERMAALYDPEKWYDGYTWCVTHWGTKWDLEMMGVESIPIDETWHMLKYNFLTAWSPPEAWVIKVAKDFPELEFRLLYYEPGVYFGGELIAKGCNAVSRCYEENIPQEILEFFE